MNNCNFIVFAQARSGSTLLRKSLHSETEVICHGEVLSRKWINGLVPVNEPKAFRSSEAFTRKLMDTRDSNLEAFLDSYIFNFGDQSIGFKIVYEDFFLGPHKDAIVSYIQSRQLKVIHLRRLNFLAALTSRKRMAKFGISHSDSTIKSEIPQKFNIPEKEVRNYIIRQIGFTNDLDYQFPDSLKIDYEGLTEQYDSVLSHLGISRPGDLKITLEKVTPSDLSEVVGNYSEVSHYDAPRLRK
ncbi:MAG: hypothetical protein ACJAYC_000202 [Halieaceae bacterium]|jgi:hypothetical protein